MERKEETTQTTINETIRKLEKVLGAPDSDVIKRLNGLTMVLHLQCSNLLTNNLKEGEDYRRRQKEFIAEHVLPIMERCREIARNPEILEITLGPYYDIEIDESDINRIWLKAIDARYNFVQAFID